MFTTVHYFSSSSMLSPHHAGMNVSLKPASRSPIEVGRWAEFNCSLPCEQKNTHTINWYIGNSPYRNVYLTISGEIEREFEEATGIQIELQDTSNCDSSSGEGSSRQRLKVFVSNSTAHLVNRTAVQCAALRKDPSDTDLYSPFRVIEVNGKYVLISM